MNIQVGEINMQEILGKAIVSIKSKDTDDLQIISPSKTMKYLVPCLREYGAIFTNKLSSVYKIAAGIGDAILINREIKHEKHIFILLDSKIAKVHFVKFMEWIRQQSMFVDDYIYGDIQKSTFHMIVIKFPEKHYTAFEFFKKGEYSKMYEFGDIQKLFKNHPDTIKVLVRDHNYQITFTKKLNEEFNLQGEHSIKPDEWNGKELDLTPTETSEIFNHHLKQY